MKIKTRGTRSNGLALCLVDDWGEHSIGTFDADHNKAAIWYTAAEFENMFGIDADCLNFLVCEKYGEIKIDDSGDVVAAVDYLFIFEEEEEDE